MKDNKPFRTTLSIIISFGLVYLLFVLPEWSTVLGNFDKPPISTQEPLTTVDKQKGAHVFSIVDSTDLPPLKDIHLEWITMVSWGFQDDIDSPIVTHHNGDSVYMMRHDSGWVHRIELAREAGFKVFFKPHLWVDAPADGKWRSDIFPANDADWELWQKTYRNFIIRYAKVAERAKADMFCIGVEFTRLSLEKPEFWRSLIQEIRGIYSGKITYAANWYKEYEKITFWDQLDFIGIQAYFPLVKNTYPSVEQVTQGWDRYIPTMVSIHEQFDRKILFTELGYRSTANSGIKPWEWVEYSQEQTNPFSAETQANCYEAFFRKIWNQKWFAGLHIWQLNHQFDECDADFDLDFTPQGKPAIGVITRWFE